VRHASFQVFKIIPSSFQVIKIIPRGVLTLTCTKIEEEVKWSANLRICFLVAGSGRFCHPLALHSLIRNPHSTRLDYCLLSITKKYQHQFNYNTTAKQVIWLIVMSFVPHTHPYCKYTGTFRLSIKNSLSLLPSLYCSSICLSVPSFVSSFSWTGPLWLLLVVVGSVGRPN